MDLSKKRKFLQKKILMAIVLLLLYLSLKFLKKKVFTKVYISDIDLYSYKRPLDFLGALDAHSKRVKWKDSEMKFIILAMTDNSFTEVALNLYISSFKRFNIDNFLFVGGGSKACKRLRKHKIQCFDFWEGPDSDRPNNYGSKEFIRKMNIRTEMILQALRANYSVLHTDLDIIFLKNPMPEIEQLLRHKDMAILWDHEVFNAGFLGIKSTDLSIHIYEDVKSITSTNYAVDDQTALNEAINKLSLKDINTSVHVLDKNRYLCGKDYYTDGRNFANINSTDNCPNCTVIHNNWIVSKAAKIHRFKETAMWYIDEDQYYSDVNRKYLLYYNPLLKNIESFDVFTVEINALKTALKIAFMLNRTLIVPRFHTKDKVECPLNSVLDITTFSHAFSPNYRESSFLLNDLVPQSIRMKPLANCSLIDNTELQASKTSTVCNKRDTDPAFRCIPFKPMPIALVTDNNKNLWGSVLTSHYTQLEMHLLGDKELDEALVRKKFDHCSDNVLTLFWLYGLDVKFSDPAKDALFDKRLGNGIEFIVASNFISNCRNIIADMDVFDYMISCAVLIWLVTLASRRRNR